MNLRVQTEILLSCTLIDHVPSAISTGKSKYNAIYIEVLSQGDKIYSESIPENQSKK